MAGPREFVKKVKNAKKMVAERKFSLAFDFLAVTL